MILPPCVGASCVLFFSFVGECGADNRAGPTALEPISAAQRACLDLLQQCDLFEELCLLGSKVLSETASNGISKCHKHIFSATCPSSGSQGHDLSCRIYMCSLIPWWPVSSECSQSYFTWPSAETQKLKQLNRQSLAKCCVLWSQRTWYLQTVGYGIPHSSCGI